MGGLRSERAAGRERVPPLFGSNRSKLLQVRSEVVRCISGELTLLVRPIERLAVGGRWALAHSLLGRRPHATPSLHEAQPSEH